MTEERKRVLNSGIFIALGFIAFGILALLNNFGFNLHADPWDYWPVVLIISGFGILFFGRDWSQYIDGFMLLAVGSLILAANLGLFRSREFDIWDWWPVLVLYIGIKIMLQSTRRKSNSASGPDDFTISAIFGGGDYRYEAKNLKGGRFTALFGGGKIDLRHAEIEGESMSIQVFAMFGGCEIQIPEHWQVFVKVVPIMGGIENKTYSRRIDGKPAGKTLYLEGMAVFGGIEIKN